MKSAEDMGYDIKLGGTFGMEWSTIEVAGKELLEGNIVAGDWPSWDEDNEWVRLVSGVWKVKGHPAETREQTYIRAWDWMFTPQKVITDAVEEVGWNQLDGAAIKAQMLNLNNWAPVSGFTPITFTEKERSSRHLRIFEIRDGKILPISDFGEAPDLKPAEYR